MSALDTLLAENEAATADLLAVASRAGDRWSVVPGPGRWSPAQVIEHVSLTLEEGAAVVSGQPTKLSSLPALLRLMARSLYYNRVLQKGAFPKSKTLTALEPTAPTVTFDDADQRLQAATRQFSNACRARIAQAPDIRHPAFGKVSVESYARFQVLHARHHQGQLPT